MDHRPPIRVVPPPTAGIEFPAPTIARELSRREQVVMAALIGVFVVMLGTLWAAYVLTGSVNKVISTQKSQHVAGVNIRTVACLTLQAAQPGVPLPAQCLDPEVIAASGGRIRVP